MPKRKRECSEYELLAKKIRKLQRKITRRRRRYRSDSSSDYASNSPQNQSECDSIAENQDDSTLYQPGCSYWDTSDIIPVTDLQEPAVVQKEVNVNETLNISSNGATTSNEQPAAVGIVNTSSSPQVIDKNDMSNPQEMIPELDPDLLDILGEDPTSSKEYGKDIQKDLAIRINHIAVSGLSKENRKELKDKYLIPANCRFIKAPTLNPEIRGSLQDSQVKRDKGIEYKQTLTSCALSSLAEAITLLLSSEQKNPDLLKLLMDTARILSDVQHTDSMSRRYFILSTVNKQLKDQLEKTKIYDMLFGNSLAETIKSAKTIISTSAQLRPPAAARSTVNRGRSTGRPLNYRAPPTSANRRQPPSGGARTRAAAATPRHTTRSTTHHSSSRTSSRQPNTRHRR